MYTYRTFYLCTLDPGRHVLSPRLLLFVDPTKQKHYMFGLPCKKTLFTLSCVHCKGVRLRERPLYNLGLTLLCLLCLLKRSDCVPSIYMNTELPG